VSSPRPSGRRFAAFVAALALAAGAFGAVALPRLAADELPPALKAPPAKKLVEQKLEDGRCGGHREEGARDLPFEAPT
jgi:hypothetical protein